MNALNYVYNITQIHINFYASNGYRELLYIYTDLKKSQDLSNIMLQIVSYHLYFKIQSNPLNGILVKGITRLMK